MIEEFFGRSKERVCRGNNETMKVAELNKVEQEIRMMEEFVQDFRKIARSSKYKEELLVEKFKRKMNRVIQRKLMKAENRIKTNKLKRK